VGTWEVGIFDDDVASDLRDAYISARREGRNQVAASEEIRAKYAEALEDYDEGAVAAVALALTQLRRDGRCLRSDAVSAARAIETLLSPERLAEWEEELRGRRRSALSAARTRLSQAKLVDPAEIKDEMTKPIQKRRPPFHVGAIIAFPLGIRDLVGFARVLEIHPHSVAMVQIYKIISTTPPSVEELRRAGPLLTFRVLSDGFGRSPDRPVMGTDPVLEGEVPTRWYNYEPWSKKWFFVPRISFVEGEAVAASEAEVRSSGAADASLGRLDNLTRILDEFARVGLLSAEEASARKDLQKAFYKQLEGMPLDKARKADKAYREALGEGARLEAFRAPKSPRSRR